MILFVFAAMSHSSVLAKEGLLNSSYEEVAAILGKPSSHDNGNVSGIQYDRYHFETSGWKTAVLFIGDKAQKMLRLTDHHSLITYHSLRIGRLAQW